MNLEISTLFYVVVAMCFECLSSFIAKIVMKNSCKTVKELILLKEKYENLNILFIKSKPSLSIAFQVLNLNCDDSRVSN